ncbi:hypothetical protein ElyMa_002671600 [Elysia marginata]|uniref:Uncharacterized protein n=1 Tax=Elysia marginata TaxID=1093978 RepID=A0AAV4HBZ2_9GAST|nr:hypothetical protein ElyMa_002671600 [Elysia marginata]
MKLLLTRRTTTRHRQIQYLQHKFVQDRYNTSASASASVSASASAPPPLPPPPPPPGLIKKNRVNTGEGNLDKKKRLQEWGMIKRRKKQSQQPRQKYFGPEVDNQFLDLQVQGSSHGFCLSTFRPTH